MIEREKVDQLVSAHRQLDEPMTGAIWIKTSEPEVWLIEVIPSMADDERADEPTFFNPGVEFRFPLALIAGNRPSLERAFRRNADLARSVVAGEIILDLPDARELMQLARQVSDAA